MNEENYETNEKIEIYLLKALLSVVRDNKEELEWLLQKQNQLRIEYLTFFKKDLKEIYSNLSSLEDTSKNEQKVNISEIIQTVIKIFREDTEKSFSIIDSKYKKSIEEEIIAKATESISNDIKSQFK